MAEDNRRLTEEFIRTVDVSTPLKVLSIVPEIEAWFFSTPKRHEHLLGKSLPEDWLSQGRRDPKGVLDRFAKRNHVKWDTMKAISSLDEKDVECVRRIPEVEELSRFLRDLPSNGNAA